MEINNGITICFGKSSNKIDTFIINIILPISYVSYYSCNVTCVGMSGQTDYNPAIILQSLSSVNFRTNYSQCQGIHYMTIGI